MKKLIILLMAMCLIGCSTNLASKQNNIYAKDVKQLIKIIEKENLLMSDKKTFDIAVEETLSKLTDEMTEQEFYLALQPIIKHSKLGVLYPQATMERFRIEKLYLPLMIETKGSKKYITDDITNSISIGSELVKINNWDMEELSELLYLKVPLLVDELNKIDSIVERDGLANEKDLIEGMDRFFSQIIINYIGSSEYKVVVKNNGKYEEHILKAIDMKTYGDYLVAKDQDAIIESLPKTQAEKYSEEILKSIEKQKQLIKENENIPTFAVKDNSIKVTLKHTGFIVKYNEFVHYQPVRIN